MMRKLLNRGILLGKIWFKHVSQGKLGVIYTIAHVTKNKGLTITMCETSVKLMRLTDKNSLQTPTPRHHWSRIKLRITRRHFYALRPARSRATVRSTTTFVHSRNRNSDAQPFRLGYERAGAVRACLLRKPNCPLQCTRSQSKHERTKKNFTQRIRDVT